MNRFRFALLAALVACTANPTLDGTMLTNSGGKDDSASLRFRLSEGSPLVGMGISCDNEQGCTGFLDVSVRTPEPCELLQEGSCGMGEMKPERIELATVTLISETEGQRVVTLAVETQDGSFINDSVSLAFSVLPGEEIDIELAQVEGAPEVMLNVRAEWQDVMAVEEKDELEQFLSAQEGLEYLEIATGYQGVRAYELYYQQPIDHNDAAAFDEGRTFRQRAILHHRARNAPVVLYTSGYDWYGDYEAELTETLQANQLDTEQRFFGASIPEGLTAELWQNVTIAQAAADHHRFVEMLRPFYEGKWIGTGHSKGGMTSVYHRRFYPDDIDLTVAYVAPISFALEDERYASFLDQIGTDECREKVRDFQIALVEQMDQFEGIAADWFTGSFELSGGLRAALEDSVENLEWGFWQGTGITGCSAYDGLAESIRSAESTAILWDIVSRYIYAANDEQLLYGANAYNYQAARQLGYQSMSTAHLDPYLQSPGIRWVTPDGTMPVYEPEAMQDIQDWVLSTDEEMIFVYGEFDPWTGGAFDVNEGTLKVTAPEATHAANIAGLDEVDRDNVLSEIEEVIGTRPGLNGGWQPSRAPRPAFLLSAP